MGDKSTILNAIRDEHKGFLDHINERDDYVRETYGLDSCEDGDILTWKKQFNENGIEYSYAAVRGGGYWYMMGSDLKWSWFALVEEIERENILPIAIYKVTEVEELFVEEEEDS